jgi:diaminopimelate decarboxylase
MKPFSRQNDVLFCEDTSLSAVAESYGTPAYIYSKNDMCARYDAFAQGLAPVSHTICYSVKANGNTALLHTLAQRGSGADIVSGGELFRALHAGISADRIVFSGVGKTEAELAYALTHDICMFNIESAQELDTLAHLASRTQKTARIALRINPDIDAKTHHFTTTAKKENKFGIPYGDAVGLYEKAAASDWIEPYGIDVHLGSPISRLQPYEEALSMCAALLDRLAEKNIPVHVLDIGGGFGIPAPDTDTFTPQQFCDLVVPFVTQRGLHLIIEPGRSIVAQAGSLLTRITYVKRTREKTFYICDTGMNDLIRPPLYNAYHDIVAVAPTGTTQTEVADVVGPVCETADFLGLQRTLPVCRRGDLLAVMDAGAYGFTMASLYNARPRACEVLVDGDVHHCIHARESYEDLIRGEHIPGR